MPNKFLPFGIKPAQFQRMDIHTILSEDELEEKIREFFTSGDRLNYLVFSNNIKGRRNYEEVKDGFLVTETSMITAIHEVTYRLSKIRPAGKLIMPKVDYVIERTGETLALQNIMSARANIDEVTEYVYVTVNNAPLLISKKTYEKVVISQTSDFIPTTTKTETPVSHITFGFLKYKEERIQYDYNEKNGSYMASLTLK